MPESNDNKKYQNIKNWLIDWFAENADVDKQKAMELSTANYFAKNWIDSFQFISFIADIEHQFGISFSNDEFQDREFSTIDGLAEIIGAKTEK